MLTHPDVLILDEPTRGVDVGAKAEIYRLIGELAKAGKAIIMVSSELPELMGLSDRIIVVREGRLVAQVQRKDSDQDFLMSYAFGVIPEEAQLNGQENECTQQAGGLCAEQQGAAYSGCIDDCCADCFPRSVFHLTLSS